MINKLYLIRFGESYFAVNGVNSIEFTSKRWFAFPFELRRDADLRRDFLIDNFGLPKDALTVVEVSDFN